MPMARNSVKTCVYCGHCNEEADAYCGGCGVIIAQASPVITRRFVLSWFPRTAAEWTRSLAYPLFGCGFSLLMFAISEGIWDHVVWRYAGPSIAGMLLPLTGITLGLVGFGPGLSRGFRFAALTLAAVLVVGGMLSPTLAE
jgi:hypothetical protein